ncbi:MAG: hypothetical protein ACRDU5_18085 [Mycobacterium sp.]
MADAGPLDPDRQLEELCRVLNDFGVRYVVFGSQVARLNGVPIETVDVDVVPERDRENLDRLAAALNTLQPRWRVDEVPGGMKIDGALEARHFLGDSVAVGVLTAAGPVDVVLEPMGYEDGYPALAPHATTVRLGRVEIRVGSLVDLVRSKELLGREKDLQHLAVLYERRPELSLPQIGPEPDAGLDPGL